MSPALTAAVYAASNLTPEERAELVRRLSQPDDEAPPRVSSLPNSCKLCRVSCRKRHDGMCGWCRQMLRRRRSRKRFIIRIPRTREFKGLRALKAKWACYIREHVGRTTP